MNLKDFILIRLEESKILKRVRYDLRAKNKEEALKKLLNMDYTTRDTIDEIQETRWNPKTILSIDKV